MPSETAVGKQGIQSEQCAERVSEYGGFITVKGVAAF
ncbi:hypothetical protein M671_10125 [Neisseria gonorrhoeae CH811]|nr:hypothetical protein M716_05010 [Neisseria gonorrhoeae SK32402]KLS57681.1 hypothetical protein M742_06440 [Neisseria gonorrhoeae NYC_2011_05_07]KLS57989.1 hypothetical protein M743_04745 [Neisseria gonorrhoeae NYC_2011_05_13]KLS67492.1 hypothetical protein M741_07810 [Neisseria gonorrhoeae NOR_2011_03-06]KLS82290.1 hypothetical protein M786_10540 [Neisseria gonorrhoeae MU_NG21]KLS91242.1 hypothetical protein M780_11000 [Neisseria gonorrhoeae MU_NG14]KLS99900.1 hypothetical protein M671_101